MAPWISSSTAETREAGARDNIWPEEMLVVLMADDREENYLLVKKAFEAGPISVDLRWVADGVEALDYLLRRGNYSIPESSPRPDLILLDLIMPRKDGLETLRQIKSNGDLRKIPIVLLASSEKQIYEVSGLRLGADSFIVKPHDFDALVEILGDLNEHYFAIIRLPEPEKSRGNISTGTVSRSIHFSADRKLTERELIRANAMLRVEKEARKKAERALQLNELRLDTLLSLSRMTETTAVQAVDFVLEEQVRLTGSEIGWIGFVNADQAHMTFYQATGGIEQNRAEGEKMHLSVSIQGVLADAAKARKTLVINERSAVAEMCKSGFPGGLADWRRLMATPVFEEDRIRAVAMVANKREIYDLADARYHQLLLDAMWKLIQRERALKTPTHTENLAIMGKALPCAARDMKTPLRAIGGFVGHVRKRMDETNPDRDKLEIVIGETRRLESMIKKMLDSTCFTHLDKSLAKR